MKKHTTGRVHLLLLGVVTVLLAFAGSAAADRVSADEPDAGASQVRYATETVTVPSISTRTVTVTCPADTTVIDGGLASESSPAARVMASGPTADGRAWQVRFWSQHPSQPLVAHAWAACLPTR